MSSSSLLFKRSVTAGALASLIGAPFVASAAPNDVVLLWGRNGQGVEQVGRLDTAGMTMDLVPACELANEFLDNNVTLPVLEAVSMLSEAAGNGSLSMPGIPQLLRCEDTSFDEEAYLIFTTCSMIMGQGTYWMRWTVPPLAAEATMVVIDTAEGKGYEVPLETRLGEVSDAVPMAMGNLRGYEITDTGREKTVTLEVSPDAGAFVAREFTARTYDFDYHGDIAAFGDMGVWAQFGRIENYGNSDIVADAPGADVISQFYGNFRDNVVPATGMSSLYGGMIRQMAALATLGIPVRTTQTSSAGMAFSMSGNYGVQSESTSTIRRIMVLPGKADSVCGPTVMPEGVDIVDLGAQIDEALSQMPGAAPGGGAPPGVPGAPAGNGTGAMPGVPGLADAMQQAMSSMTPEQQAAMAQASGSLGAMLGGLMGGGLGANPNVAANTGGAPSPGAAGGAAAPPAAGQSGSSLSSALMTENLTQSAQNLLQALGYDTGNADGELSIETTIAISQFQAEQGLEVTGEVTPQLVGILAAEVDQL